MKLRNLRLLAILGAAAPGDALAQERDTTRADSAVFRVPEIQVVATRPVTTVGGSSAIEVRVDSLSLPAAPTLEQVLREIPMLHVRTNSRGEAELSARGSESRQVAVLVDGVPLTLAWDSRTDVSVIPAASVQEIGFVRGLSSMLYGPNVLGGIVELGVGRSFLQPSARSLQVTTGFDHVGGYGGSATIGIPGTTGGGEWLFRAGAAYRDSPGQPLADGIVEPIPTGDDDLRLNTDVRSVNGFLSFRYHGDGGAWLTFSGSSFRAERGIAAELGVDDARFWRYPHVARTIAVASAGTGDRASPLGGRGDVELSLGLDAGRAEIDAYTSREYRETDGFEDGRDRTLTLRLLADQSAGARGELRGAFTLSEIRHDESLPDAEARYRQRLLSIGAENNWRLVESGAGLNSLRLSVGGALDVAETPESGGREPRQGHLDEWGARVGLSAAVNGGNTLLHAGASRRGRFPSLRELYSGALNRFQPNPNLRPENLVALETGVTTRVGSGELQAVAFRHRLNDAVVRITLPDRKFLRVNRNRLDSRGIELLATQALGPVQLAGDLTVQAVDLTDTEAEETHRPENLPEVFGRVEARFPLPAGLRGRADADYVGDQFCIDPGTGEDAELKAGTHVNLELSRAWSFRPRSASWFNRLEGRISVDNVGDVARYDQCGLPQPGRLLRFQIRLF
ncbi:MAG TPA: TonB-dependent receptor [Longimicrobiales bacterium]|nr:TonB-dependent receptor [Longimicrobiales bacterium]